MARCPGLGAQEGIEILSACFEEYCAKGDDGAGDDSVGMSHVQCFLHRLKRPIQDPKYVPN